MNQKTLELTGDIDRGGPLFVIAPSEATTVSWNGKKLCRSHSDFGVMRTHVGPSVSKPFEFKLPTLGPWRHHDGLPEIGPDYVVSSEAWICKLYLLSHAQKRISIRLLADDTPLSHSRDKNNHHKRY